MTDKLKCPFCGAELASHIDEWKSIRKLFICNNTGCFCWGQPMLLEIWQALIDGKKAQDALKKVRRKARAGVRLAEDAYRMMVNSSPGMEDTIRVLGDIVKITSITKGKDNDLGTVD